MSSFKEALAHREAQRWNEKIASIGEALGDDQEAVQIFDAAIDMVKEAGYTDPNQIVDGALELTVAALSDGGEKVAHASEVDYEALGYAAAKVANFAGITSDDIMKIASDEESEALGRLLAHCVYTELQAGM